MACILYFSISILTPIGFMFYNFLSCVKGKKNLFVLKSDSGLYSYTLFIVNLYLFSVYLINIEYPLEGVEERNIFINGVCLYLTYIDIKLI